MPTGAQTCPKCLMRVFPLQDGRCPSCRSFDFTAGPVDEDTSRAAVVAASREQARKLHRAGVLHWRFVWYLVPLGLLAIVNMWVQFFGTAFLGEPQPDKTDVQLLLAIVFIGCSVAAGGTARALAAEVSTRAHSVASWDFTRLLKESLTYFEEPGIPTGFFGPKMSALPTTADESRE